MKEQTCCFTGHRKIPQDDMQRLKKALKYAIREKIAQGVLYFGAGGALGFDTIAAKAVIELKNEFPEIKLILVLPCPEQDKFWSVNDKKTYREIIEQADKVTVIDPHYTRECMYKRNRHLVDNSVHCICYLTEETGGTAYTVKYAEKNGLDIINVASRL